MGRREPVDLASLLEASEWSSPLLTALFETADAVEAAARITHVVGVVGPVAGATFVHPGVGLVVGLALRDGREVVAKVHRWNVTAARLVAVQQVQAHLAGRGLPAPRPLLAPVPLGTGFATVEEWRAGGAADGRDPAVRRLVAGGLIDVIRVASELDPVPRVGVALPAPALDGPLWDEPHDVRFDFEATAAGAEWIDDLARTARARLAEVDLPLGIAHLDWRIENLGIRDGRLIAIYDWDAVGLAPEAVAVGQAAAQFSSDWARVGWAGLPDVAEMRSFVDDCERHRGRPFTTAERVALDAANLWLCAYGARCEHSDRVLHPNLAGPLDGGWSALLRARGVDALRG